MFRPFESIVDLGCEADVLARRRYGVIDVVDGRLVAVHLRPWPKLVTWCDAAWFGRRTHTRLGGDRCRLYYHQPRRWSMYLALAFVVSQRGTTYRSFVRALQVLDEVARIKRSDALLCDVQNGRISDRLLRRQGWEPHAPSRFHRNFIKRFYGQYPVRPAWLEPLCAVPPAAGPGRTWGATIARTAMAGEGGWAEGVSQCAVGHAGNR